MTQVIDIVKFIEGFAPQTLAEEWDQVGLMVGSFNQEVKKVLVCLDVTNDVVKKSIAEKFDLIVSHHPLFFKPLKRLTENTDREKMLMELVRNKIAVYSAHTNLDISEEGTNSHLANVLGLKDTRNYKTLDQETLYKLVVYVPMDFVEKVRNSMTQAGAGSIGEYQDCSFMMEGMGTFRPMSGADPFIGQKGTLEYVKETRIETVVTKDKIRDVLKAIKSSHPYEEVAYDLFRNEIESKQNGLGKIGILPKPLLLKEFAKKVKSDLNASAIRMIGGELDKKIETVGVFTGSFDGDIGFLEKSGIDVLVTGDVKYHTALDIVETKLCVIDAGHFYTEVIISDKIAKLLQLQFKDINVYTSNGIEKDPFMIV